MAAFTAKGDRAEWRILYDFLRDLSIGDVARYDALDEILGRSFLEEGAKRNPLERARRELERADQRTLAVVKGIGYRVVEPREHMDLAKNHQARSRRQVVKAKQKLESTNLAALSRPERERWEAMQVMTAHHLSQERYLAQRVARLERALDKVRNTEPS